MPAQDTAADDRLPILVDRGVERNLFSLEMGPDGVRLRLGGAVLGDWLVLQDLVLRVPHVPRSFDYTAGPRSLQSALTRLESVVVEVRVDGLASRVAGIPGIEVAGLRARAGRLSLSGVVDGAPFTLRLVPRAPACPGSGRGDLEIGFEDPRVYGWTGRAWDRLGIALASALPAVAQARAGKRNVVLDVLRPVLVPLLAGMGCKVPLLDGVVLASLEADGNRLTLRYEAAETPVAVVSSPPGSPEPDVDPETEARSALEAFRAGGEAADGARLLWNGLASPRLWPEVLVAARVLGEDRPEWVLPHLAGLILAARMPEIVVPADLAVLARRLLAAVEVSGDAADLVLAGRLVATVALDLEPVESLALVDAIRARGVTDPVVMEAAALAMDRLGRGSEARAVRARLLALAPAGRTAEVLRSVVDRLDRAGLGSVASGWLDETIARCDEGRFGSECGAIRRRALLLAAVREALSGDPAGRRRLLDLLRSDPGDREALDLLLVTARTDRESAEAVARMQDAAASVSGPERAELLKDAARAMADRLGLRRQAIPLLEDALAAQPRDAEAADLLDRLCLDLGMDDRRLALARTRLSWASDPDARVEALLGVARLAERTGALDEAGRCLSEILRIDPTNREALETGVRVFAASGDETALVQAWNSLLDLDSRPA